MSKEITFKVDIFVDETDSCAVDTLTIAPTILSDLKIEYSISEGSIRTYQLESNQVTPSNPTIICPEIELDVVNSDYTALNSAPITFNQVSNSLQIQCSSSECVGHYGLLVLARY